MNIEYELGDYKFEWDSEKNKINKKKHEISFETAARVFLDKNLIDDFDKIHSVFEDRIKVVGLVGKVLAVIYTERGETYEHLGNYIQAIADYDKAIEMDDYAAYRNRDALLRKS